MKFLKKVILVVVFLAAAYFFIDVGRYLIYPDITNVKKNFPKRTAFMEYRQAQWKERGVKRNIVNKPVSLSQISPYAVKAIIIAEDDKFWFHEGFDFAAMKKALEKDIQKRKFHAGGSTISQQLAKNLYLSPAKTPVRKMKEAILVWRLERNLSKRRIIELYLNVAEWGDGVFGIEAAAQKYYGKSASELDPRQAAALAAVLPNPLRYKPTADSRYVENRTERIYSIMVRRGIVIPEYEEIVEERSPVESTTEADQEANNTQSAEP